MGQYNPPADLTRMIGELTTRLAALERTRGVLTGSGAPTAAAGDGALYVDTTTGPAGRLYVRVGGAWHYVALT